MTKKKNNKLKRTDIKIGYLCNNQCKFCVQGDRRKLLGNRPGKEIKKSIKEAGKEYNSIVFTGGEATVREDFISLVKYAKDLGFDQIQIQSNGRMFSYVEFCIKSIQAGANEFSPALHGPNAKIHDFLTGAKGSFEQTVQGIKNLKKFGQKVITNTVITTKNYKLLPELAELFVSLKVDQFQFAFVHIVGSADENKEWIVPKKSEAMPYIKKGLDIGIKAGLRVMTEAIPYCLMKGYEDCIAEEIIPDGQVVEYERVIKDYRKYRNEIGKAKREECKKCKYYEKCEGPWKEYIDIYGWQEFRPVKK